MSEREVLYGNENNGDYKPITAFHALKTMAPNTKIEGKHIARNESKNKQGAFYHLFENEAGEVHGYGTCKVLDERVNEFKAKCEEMGHAPENLMMSTTFLGRLPNKTNGNTSYKFTGISIFKPKTTQSEPTTASTQPEASRPIDSTDIPF